MGLSKVELAPPLVEIRRIVKLTYMWSYQGIHYGGQLQELSATRATYSLKLGLSCYSYDNIFMP